MKNLYLFLAALMISVASFAQAPAPITGPASVCAGPAFTYSDATAGGTWSVSDASVATISPLTGILTGLTAGSVVITYTLPSSADTVMPITVLAGAGTLGGPTTVCIGGNIAISDPVGGGSWSSASTTIATVDASGNVYGVTAGIDAITYTVGSGCSVSENITVVAAPPSISGVNSVCVGGTTTLGALGGGTWSSSSSAVASVGLTTGIVIGASPGTAIITYSLGIGCSTNTTVTVNIPPGTITGPSSVCTGSFITLSDFTPGGSWSSSSPAVAVVGSTGIVGGIAPGVANIFYSITAGCYVTHVVTVNAAPLAIAGPSNICVGVPTTYTDVVAGGTWTTSAAYVTLDVLTGVATGVSTGVATISYSIPTGCSATKVITVSAAPAVYNMTGGGSYCSGGVGVHIGLDGSDAGVSYQLFDGGVAIAGPMVGTGLAIDFGLFSVSGTYTIVGTNTATGCTANMSGSVTISVSPLPAVFLVTGGGAYCAGGAGVDVALNNSSAGVSYQLYNGISAVGAPVMGTGSVLDFGNQTAAGTYTVVGMDGITGCTSNMAGSAVVTVTSPVTPSVSIGAAPGTTVCPGTIVVFTATPTNGGSSPTYEWTVNGTSVATGVTYTYVPIDGDVVGTTLTSSTSCVTSATATDNVTMSAGGPSVTASASGVACDGTYTLTAGGATTYVWTGAGLSCSSCSSPSAYPSSTTTYVVTGTDGMGCSNTANVTVNGNRVMGMISPAVGGTIKVWLVQFNPSDSSITALDSTTACTSGGIQYYQFASPASGDYLVKAFLQGQTPGTSGYLPTYATSSAYWYSATSISHTSGTENVNVTMISGTVPAGPGFIGGLVAAGAGKGTAGSVPVMGMLIYLKDASNNILTYTFTDAGGHYSFSGIANGDYVIYPEDYQYTTAASATVTLSTSTESVSGINFKQHTGNHTITPWDYTAVTLLPLTNQITVYPNPTSGDLNIKWDNQASGVADVIVTDIVGREVFKSAINITSGSGQALINLQGLHNGLYQLNIKNENMTYSGKLSVER